MSPTDERPGLRLTVPSDPAHASLIRACVRDAVIFDSDDHETSVLVTVTEVVDDLIEATGAMQADARVEPVIVIDVFGPPDARLVISDLVDRSTRIRLGLEAGRARVASGLHSRQRSSVRCPGLFWCR